MKPAIRFSTLLQAFFTQRLMQQKQVSPHTIDSYRDTFRLLLKFIQKHRRKQPASLLFEDIDAPLVCAFLDDLESVAASVRVAVMFGLPPSAPSSSTRLSKCPPDPSKFNACWSFRVSAIRALRSAF